MFSKKRQGGICPQNPSYQDICGGNFDEISKEGSSWVSIIFYFARESYKTINFLKYICFGKNDILRHLPSGLTCVLIKKKIKIHFKKITHG